MSKITEAIQTYTGLTDPLTDLEATQIISGYEMDSNAKFGEVFNPFDGGTSEKLVDIINNAQRFISTVIISKNSVKDPLKNVFYKGVNRMGGLIQTISTDVIDTTPFNNTFVSNPYALALHTSESQLFGYKLDRRSKVSIPGTQIEQYFASPESLNDYVYTLIDALIAGHRIEQYHHEKLIFSFALMTGQTGFKVAPTAADLVSEIAETIADMQYPTKNYNQGIARASDAEDLVIILTNKSSNEIDFKFVSTTFNAEIAQNSFSMSTRVRINAFSDVWLYNKDHVVTQEDIDKGWIQPTNPDAIRPIGVGTVIKAGSIAYAGATDAGVEVEGQANIANFLGANVQAYVCDKEHIIYMDDLPIYVSSYGDKDNRVTHIVAHSKESLAVDVLQNACGFYKVAPRLTGEQADELTGDTKNVETETLGDVVVEEDKKTKKATK